MTPNQKLAREQVESRVAALIVVIEGHALQDGPAQPYWLNALDNLSSVIKNTVRAVEKMEV